MRVPLSWLKDFAPIEADTPALVDALNELGLVVDGVTEIEAVDEGVVVARVQATRAHPDADKVQLVDVDAGGEQLQIVCGAFNFGAGDLVPLARTGTTLPNGLTIERRQVRGQWSEGMLCSAAPTTTAASSCSPWMPNPAYPCARPWPWNPTSSSTSTSRRTVPTPCRWPESHVIWPPSCGYRSRSPTYRPLRWGRARPRSSS